MHRGDASVRVLLIGEAGMLGQDLRSTAPPHMDLRTASDAVGDRFDVTDRDRVVAALDETRPHSVINAAAYTNVDDAEHEPQRALAVNATAVGRLGDACAARDIRVVHFSTDYVFAGDGERPYREDDPPNPINAYGLSKLNGEHALAASGARALIVRSQWLFGRAGRSFPRTM
jgi:dTDP-4-dehydrorhamnose reductase